MKNYKPAKLYQGKGQWYVQYRFLIPGTTKYKRFKEYFDINRIKPISERILFGKEMERFINKKLSEGFNPFECVRFSIDNKKVVDHLKLIVETLSLNQSKCTISTYGTMLNRFQNFIYSNALDQLSFSEIDVTHANSFKQYLLSKQLASKTINTTLSHTGLFWDAAIEKKIAAINPFRQISQVKKKLSEDDIFEPITPEELTIIFTYLLNNSMINYLRFLAVIYYAWVRPVEILRLRVGQINLINKPAYIRFRNLETKNKSFSFVQIIEQLKILLEQMNLSQYPSDYYLFSENFVPGINPLYFKKPGKIWNKTVINFLGINKKMYALKHSGNIEYLLNNSGNTDLKWQQMQNRHKSAAMTERYNRKLGAYFINTENVKFRSII